MSRTKVAETRKKVQEIMYRNTTNVEYEMYDYTGNNWGHRNSNKSFKKDLETVPRKHSLESLKKTAVHGTSHIIRNVPQSETSSLSGGDHCWFRRSTMEQTWDRNYRKQLYWALHTYFRKC